MNIGLAASSTVCRLLALVLLVVAHAAFAAEGDYIVTFPGGRVPPGLAAQVARLGGSITFAHNAAGIAVVRGLNETAAMRLSADAGITSVVADVAFRIENAPANQVLAASPSLAARVATPVLSPSDPTSAFFYGLGWQWNLQTIHAQQAWAAGKLGSPDVTVAIIDTGIDYQSFDLQGLVDLSRSISLVPSDDALAAALFPGVHPSTDLNGHGTHVASQVASNALAFAGVTSRTRLMSVKVARVDRIAFVSTALTGVIYAADSGADVANMSLGGLADRNAPENFRLVSAVQQVFDYANKKKMVIVAGAGNDASDLDRNRDGFFAYCDGVHVACVSAAGPLTPTGSPYIPAIYTNYGRSAVTVAAPGGNLGGPVSQWPWGPFGGSLVWALCSRTTVILDAAGNPIATPFTSGTWVCGNVGTSLATPHATGLAALLVAEYGKQEPAQVLSKLARCTIDPGQPGTDKYFGHGHIDLARCM